MQGLLERESELDALDVALEAARSGDGQALLVAGPAGIGKTRLLAAAGERCGADTLVLRARGGPLEHDFSYGVMRQLLERHLAQAGESRREALLDGAAALALPAIGPLTAPQPTAVDAAFSIRHGLHWLVANLAQEQPVVLLVDDLHWADPASLRALAYLAARLDGLPVLLLGGWRSGEAVPDQEPLDELERLAATVLRPAPLATASVRAFLEAAGGSPSPELVEAVHNATGGNPFLLEELLRSLRAEGLDVASARPDTVERLGPRGVARALVVRLGRLPATLTTVARAIAVLAGNAHPGPVAALAGIEPEELAAAVDALVAAEILAPGRPYTYLHPTMRAAVYEDTPRAQREALHAAAVDALRREGLGEAELAPHLLAAAPAGDAAAVASLRAAAAVAVAQGAPDLAVRYLKRGLEEPPDDGQRSAVLAELGDAEWLAGEDPEGAIDHLRAAFEDASDPALRLERALALHRALFARGRLAEAMELLEEELHRSGPLVDREVSLRVESELASIGLLHPSTVELADARLAEYEDLEGATPAELLQLANVACWKWAKGTADETVEIGRRSMADARIQAADPSDSLPIYEALWALAHTDELEFARDVLGQTVADARARGSVFGITTSCGLLVLVALREGDTATAEVEGRRAAGLPGLSDFIRPPLFGYLAQALVWRGELDAAEWAIGESGCGPDLPEFVCLNPVFGARGWLRLAQGRAEEALRDFEELGARSERIGLLNPVQGWRLGATAALVRLDRAGDAILLAKDQLRLARRWGTASAIGIAMHSLALARGGDGEELAEAERVLARAPDRLEHARCLVDLGARLRSDGRRRDAREPLRQALDIAWRGGAEPLARRAHEELLAAGARPRRLTSTGADALTPSERRVAGLAAEGRTNREIAQELFVTPKTVENQLGRVYTKLGVSSRRALGAALAATEDAGRPPAEPRPLATKEV